VSDRSSCQEMRMSKQRWFWAMSLTLVAALPANAQVTRGVISMENARSNC
jgi:hypothetical protein